MFPKIQTIPDPKHVRVNKISSSLIAVLFSLLAIERSYSIDPTDSEIERLKALVRCDMSVAIVRFSPRYLHPRTWADRPGLIPTFNGAMELDPKYTTIEGRFNIAGVITKFDIVAGDISENVRMERRWGGGRNYQRLHSLENVSESAQYYVASGDSAAKKILDCHFFGPFSLVKIVEVRRLVKTAIATPREVQKDNRMYPSED